MANMVSDGQCGGKGSYNVGLLCSLFGQFVSLIIFDDVCVGTDIVGGDIVVRGF